MGAAILENIPVTRSEDSRYFAKSPPKFRGSCWPNGNLRGILRNFARNVMAERSLSFPTSCGQFNFCSVAIDP